MKYVFIVNPFAGMYNAMETLVEPIKAICEEKGLECEFKETDGPGHATVLAAEAAAAATEENPVRVYAVGGDGTLCEVASGILNKPNVELGAIPCGSGNDYIKCYGETEDFLDLKNYICSDSIYADAINVVSEGVNVDSINIASIGFDANVCETTNQIKSANKKLASRKAYNRAVVKCLFGNRSADLKVTFDDNETFEGKYTFSFAASGRYYGSGMQCAPMADPNDNKLELMLVKSVGLLKMATMIGDYTSGEYFGKKKYQNLLIHRTGKKMHIVSKTPTYVNVDGETFPCTEVTFELMPNAFRFIAPKVFWDNRK